MVLPATQQIKFLYLRLRIQKKGVVAISVKSNQFNQGKRNLKLLEIIHPSGEPRLSAKGLV